MKFALCAIASGLIAAFLPAAIAQVPPHRPGTICFTAYAWCWLDPAQQVGTPCTCRTSRGVVNGQAG